MVQREECVARVFPFRDGRELAPGWKLRRQILQRVDREVHLAGCKRIFDLFGEHPLGADLRERNFSDPVAGGLDDLYLDVVTARAQLGSDVVRLPEREL